MMAASKDVIIRRAFCSPAGVKFGETIPARFEPATVAALDKWAVAHRPEAIRWACRDRAEGKGVEGGKETKNELMVIQTTATID
jgi:hypothetical protein